MIKNKHVIGLSIIAIVTYLISDLLFNDAILYFIGGIFGALLKPVGLQNSFMIVWLIALIGTVVLFQKMHSRVLKYATFILLWVLLYLFDAILYKLLPDRTSKATMYLHIGLSVFLKTISLIWIYYMGNRKPIEAVQ